MTFICKKSHYSDLGGKISTDCHCASNFTNDYKVIIKSNPDFSRDHAILIYLTYLGLKRSARI